MSLSAILTDPGIYVHQIGPTGSEVGISNDFRCPVSRLSSHLDSIAVVIQVARIHTDLDEPECRISSMSHDDRFDRISHQPDVLGGKATIRGLRISVAHVVNLVANGMTPGEIVQDLPDLDEQDVRQALAYAAALAQDEMHSLGA